MLTFELHTRAGEYMTTVPGPAIAPAPDVTQLPEVIVWGLRLFVLDREAGQYREATTYFVPLEKF